MAQGEFAYRKLPGDFRGFFRRHTLWLGPDHLLQVDSSRFSETYKRFYLTDIQAIVVRKSPRFVIPYYWVLVLLGASIALAVVAATPRHAAWITWVLLSAIVGVGLYLYIACVLQSCTCHLMTRVSNVQLRSVFRLRAARHLVAIVAPRLEALQGALPAGWVERSFELPEYFTAADRNPESIFAESPGGAFSWVTVGVFVCGLMDAGLTWLQLSGASDRSLSAPNVVNMIALAVCTTFSLVQLTRGRNGGTLRAFVLAALLIVAGVNYGSVLIQSFDQQFFHRQFQSSLDYPGMRWLCVTEIVLDALIASGGLLLAFRRPQVPERPRSLFDTGAPQE